MRVMLLVEGINNDPASWNDWPNRLAPLVNERPPGDWKAQGLLYSTEALTVGVSEGERVQTFADILTAYHGAELHAWGHSNGTRIILGGCAAAFAEFPDTKLKTVHLLCGACDADFDANGLNAALAAGLVGDVYVYVAGADSAMRVENTAAGDLLFGIPFGHQPLGLNGPQNVKAAVLDRVHVLDWPGWDHSTCWAEGNFNGTVEQVMTLAAR